MRMQNGSRIHESAPGRSWEGPQRVQAQQSGCSLAGSYSAVAVLLAEEAEMGLT